MASLDPDRPGFRKSRYVGSDDKQKTDAALKMLAIRQCHINHQKLQNSLEEKKKNPFINQFVFQDQYKDFLVFEPPHLDIVITYCLYTLDHNRNVNIHED